MRESVLSLLESELTGNLTMNSDFNSLPEITSNQARLLGFSTEKVIVMKESGCPFTLYEYFVTVFNKRMFMREPLDIELVAKEVMYIHYSLMVGLIPLAETVHDLVHNQVLFIPLDNVMGNYQLFEQLYAQFIPEESKEKLKAMRKQTDARIKE